MDECESLHFTGDCQIVFTSIEINMGVELLNLNLFNNACEKDAKALSIVEKPQFFFTDWTIRPTFPTSKEQICYASGAAQGRRARDNLTSFSTRHLVPRRAKKGTCQA